MKTQIICIAAATLFSISGVQAGVVKTIKMTSVIYGNLQSGKTCDATQYVARLCNGKQQCNVDVGNGSLCGDPDFLTVKKAMIDYKCGQNRHRILQDEYHAANVACD